MGAEMSEETNVPDRLDDKQERALQMIILGEQDIEIAATLGINRKTIYRWRKYDVQFMRALDERQALMREMAATRRVAT